MNYKVSKTMLILCVVYLLGFYVLKFFFPEILLQSITSPTILTLGKFINSWIGFEYIIGLICSFATLYLFACASSGNFKLSKISLIVISVATILITLVLDLLPELYTHTSIVLMFACAVAQKGKLSYATISFALHGYLSQFLLSIRGFETIIIQISEIGLLSSLILGFEMYVWLVLLAIIFNIKEKENE